MYTGIIQAIGQIHSIESKGDDKRIQILTAALDMSDVALGDSIAVNGVCLTVTAFGHDHFWADVSSETLRLTSLKTIKKGSEVNLEKSLRLSDRLGGHFVQGHVDGLGEVINIRSSARAHHITIRYPAELAKYIAPKGSICVDGTSLTVNAVTQEYFELMIIPHTWENTVFKHYKVGTEVNLETDMLARYIERMLSVSTPTSSPLTKDLLTQAGFTGE